MMKNKFFLFACLALFALSSCEKGGDYIEFEDNVLMQRCLLLEDFNQDGKLSYDEAKNIESLNVNNLGIKSLNGIERLPNLKSLVISNNPIHSFVLRNNSQLEGVLAENCPLHNIDLSGCINLKRLVLSGASLDHFVFSSFPNLSRIQFSSCGLKEMDLRNNTKLEELTLNNEQISSLNLSANIALEKLSLYDLPVKNLDLSNNKNLTSLYISGMQLDPIKYSLPLLHYVYIFNSSASLDLSDCPAVGYLKISDSYLKSLVLNEIVSTLSISNSTVDNFNHSRCVSLTQVSLDNTPIQKLDLSNTDERTIRSTYNISINNCSLKEICFPKYKLKGFRIELKNNLLTEISLHVDTSYNVDNQLIIKGENHLSTLYLNKDAFLYGITFERSSQYISDNIEIIYFDE